MLYDQIYIKYTFVQHIIIIILLYRVHRYVSNQGINGDSGVHNTSKTPSYSDGRQGPQGAEYNIRVWRTSQIPRSRCVRLVSNFAITNAPINLM